MNRAAGRKQAQRRQIRQSRKSLVNIFEKRNAGTVDAGPAAAHGARHCVNESASLCIVTK